MKTLRLAAALLCLLLAGCGNTSASSEIQEALVDVSDYSVHYLTGKAPPNEYPPEEVSLRFMMCGREASELIAATVEICMENGIDHNTLLTDGNMLYSTEYKYQIFPMKFDGGRLLVGIYKHVEDGVIYKIISS